MKRTHLTVFLTLVSAALGSRDTHAQSGAPTIDVEVTELIPVWNNVAARLCPGSGNAVRVALAWHGVAPLRAVSVRLALTLPGGPAAGMLVAEGTVTLQANTPVTTFTFLHVEVPDRLRGRGAQLVVRANADHAIAERDLGNNERQLAIDAATDWSCKRAGDELLPDVRKKTRAARS